MYRPRNTVTKRVVQKRQYEVQDASIFAGPATWMMLHSMAATYEPSQKESFTQLITGIQNNFPCKRCRDNFIKHLKELPLHNYLGNRDELFLWTYLMHDKVNQLKHVKSPPLQNVKKYYFESLGIECSNCG